MIDNFQIYYQPAKNSNNDIKSISLKLYEFDVVHACYRTKIVLEKGENKYKIKKYTGGLPVVLNRISLINFDGFTEENVNYDDDYYLIRHGDKKIETNSKAKVQSILDLFGFDEIDTDDLREYKLCD